MERERDDGRETRRNLQSTSWQMRIFSISLCVFTLHEKRSLNNCTHFGFFFFFFLDTSSSKLFPMICYHFLYFFLSPTFFLSFSSPRCLFYIFRPKTLFSSLFFLAFRKRTDFLCVHQRKLNQISRNF